MAGAFVAALVFSAAANAHQSPQGCAATAPTIAFSSATLKQLEPPARIGDRFDLQANVGNPSGPGAPPCDISQLTVRIHPPSADGRTGEGITLAEDVTLDSGTPGHDLDASLPYTVDLAEKVFQAPMEISWSAVIHDREDTFETGNGRGASLVVTRPSATLEVTPHLSSGQAPLTINYSYALTNTSPVDGSALAVPSILPGSGLPSGPTGLIGDDRCEPVIPAPTVTGLRTESTAGPVPGLPGLFPGLTWNFSCTTTFQLPGTYSSQPVINAISGADGRPWPNVAITSTPVTVIGSDLIVNKRHEGDLLAGRNGEYLLKVSNRGNRPTAGPVELTDQLPGGLKATAISGEGWRCKLDSLSCQRSDPLASGLSYPDVILKVTVAAKPPDHVVNTASVSGGGESPAATGNNTASDPTRIRTPGVVAAPTSAAMRAKRIKHRRSGATVVTFSVNGPGRLTADDARKPNLIKRATRKTSAAGTYSLVLRPTPRLRRKLKRTRRTARVRVKVRFKARTGASRTRVGLVPFRPRPR